MTIRDIITQEITSIRAKAQADFTAAETQAKSLESKLGTLPAEIEGLAEDAAQRVWAWVKGA